MPPIEDLIATVKRVPFKNDSGWAIIVTDKGTAKGTVGFEIKPGDCLKLSGAWQHSEFSGGNEFNFKAAILHLPEEPRALLRYAVSLTKGLGEAKEEAIWEKYGGKWREVEDLDLPGISKATAFHWQDTLRRLRESFVQTQAMAFLLDHGCTLNLATAAWCEWRADTVGKVNADPYALCDLPHYGFAWIDENIRPRFGISGNDPRRVDAAIAYVMSQLAEKQGTALPISDVGGAVQALIGSVNGVLPARLDAMCDAGKLVRIADGCIALQKDWEHEAAIWERWKA